MNCRSAERWIILDISECRVFHSIEEQALSGHLSTCPKEVETLRRLITGFGNVLSNQEQVA